MADVLPAEVVALLRDGELLAYIRGPLREPVGLAYFMGLCLQRDSGVLEGQPHV